MHELMVVNPRVTVLDKKSMTPDEIAELNIRIKRHDNEC